MTFSLNSKLVCMKSMYDVFYVRLRYILFIIKESMGFCIFLHFQMSLLFHFRKGHSFVLISYSVLMLHIRHQHCSNITYLKIHRPLSNLFSSCKLHFLYYQISPPFHELVSHGSSTFFKTFV